LRIRCLDCGFSEEVNLDFFVKVLGGATAGFGFWAWTSFLFAGTGFAMAICIAIIAGGAAMLTYKDEIIDWIANEGYECDSCGKKNWTAVSPGVEKEISAKEKSLLKELAAQDLQARIVIVTSILRSENMEFEQTEDGWIILEPSGDLKQINGISELEQYAAIATERAKSKSYQQQLNSLKAASASAGKATGGFLSAAFSEKNSDDTVVIDTASPDLTKMTKAQLTAHIAKQRSISYQETLDSMVKKSAVTGQKAAKGWDALMKG
jgi:hypothetical protein